MCFDAERSTVPEIENWIKIEFKYETKIIVISLYQSYSYRTEKNEKINIYIFLVLKRVWGGHKYVTQRSEVKNVTVGLWIRSVFTGNA